MRLLIFSFVRGAPGVGLLIARVAFGLYLLIQTFAVIRQGGSTAEVLLHAVSAGGAVLLLLGLWTRVAAMIIALAALLYCHFHQAQWWQCILFGTIATTLALLGPGAWSLDARRAGWKRIEIPRR